MPAAVAIMFPRSFASPAYLFSGITLNIIERRAGTQSNSSTPSTPPRFAVTNVPALPERYNSGRHGVRLKENSVDNTQTNPTPTDTAQATNESASADQSRRTRQPSMAQIMESDEFSAYLSGAENLTRNALLKGIVAHVDENTGVLLVDVGALISGEEAKAA